jgi:hypothetical protein
MVKKKIAYRPYSLKKLMMVSKLKFNTIIISSHYEEDHPYMTDEKILKIAKQLDKRDDFVPHLQGTLPNGVE